jgi:hypothetical protein
LFCTVPFTPPKFDYQAFCSRRCNQRYRRAGYPAPRRALKSGIGDRDGWRCRICGGRVAKWRRWPDPFMASVDHIVLVALGGSNDESNLRLAHLICNMRRGGWVIAR